MSYPKLPEYNKLTQLLDLQAQLKTEYGAKGIADPLARAERAMRAALRELQTLPVDRELARREPNDLKAIRVLRPQGPRRLWTGFHAGHRRNGRHGHGQRLHGGDGREYCRRGCRQAPNTAEVVQEFWRHNSLVPGGPNTLLDPGRSPPLRDTSQKHPRSTNFSRRRR